MGKYCTEAIVDCNLPLPRLAMTFVKASHDFFRTLFFIIGPGQLNLGLHYFVPDKYCTKAIVDCNLPLARLAAAFSKLAVISSRTVMFNKWNMLAQFRTFLLADRQTLSHRYCSLHLAVVKTSYGKLTIRIN